MNSTQAVDLHDVDAYWKNRNLVDDRHRPYCLRWLQLDLMSGFMAELRAITEKFGRKRGNPVLVAIRVPDSFEYNLCVSDDPESPVARERPPKIEADLLVNLTQNADFKLRVNGTTIASPAFTSDNSTNGVFRFDIPLSCIRHGPNRFEVESPFVASADKDLKLVDFVLKYNYPPTKKVR